MWSKRTLIDINTILVHQTGKLPEVERATLYDINDYHRTPSFDRDGDGKIDSWERNHLTDTGAPGICYHFVLERSGRIFQTNRISDVVWGAKGYNGKSIHILVNGNFVGPEWVGTETPSAGQLRNLKRLIRILAKRYDIKIENIKGHGEINPYKINCPGDVVMAELNKFKETFK